MDRQKLIDAIVEKFRNSNPLAQQTLLVEALRRISDPNLIVFAIDNGINTDVLFTKPA